MTSDSGLFECVDRAFKTKLDNWDLVTTKCDVESQPLPTEDLIDISIASFGFIHINTQDDKTVSNLKQIPDNESPKNILFH